MRILGGCDIVIGVTSASPIRVLAVDDHPLIRAGVVAFLATEPDLQVVAEAANGEEALEQYRELRDRKSTRLNSSHRCISYAVFCLKKKKMSGAQPPAVR